MTNLYWGRFGFIEPMHCCTTCWHYRIMMSMRRKRNENEIFSFIILINILNTDYFLNFFSRNKMSKYMFFFTQADYSARSPQCLYALFFFIFHILTHGSCTNPRNLSARSIKIRGLIVYKTGDYLRTLFMLKATSTQ
jgi:hypothetical protein